MPFKPLLICALIGLLSGCEAHQSPSSQHQATTAEPAKTVEAQQTPTEEPWIIASQRFGPLAATTSEEALKTLLGASNVVPGSFYFAEGTCLPGTDVYPNDPKKKFTIAWADPDTRQKPNMVQIDGESSAWKTKEGLSLGSTMAELERANGKPFSFSGFDWDYGGYVSNWRHGKLEAPLNGISLRLSSHKITESMAPGQQESPIKTYGEGEFSSTEVKGFADKIVVDKIVFHFLDNRPADPEQLPNPIPCDELEKQLLNQPNPH